MKTLGRLSNLKSSIRVVSLSLIFGILFNLQAQAKDYTIGIVSHVSIHTPVIDGFKKGMAEAGYIQGRDIIYLYNGVTGPDVKAVEVDIRNMLAKRVNMMFTLGAPVSLAAKKAVEGTSIPVVFSAAVRPVELGIVEDIRRPGGNLTGVTPATTTHKALEWLVKVIPGAKRIFLPYNPEDVASVMNLSGLDQTAAQLGIQLTLGKIRNVEEAVMAIKNLPQEFDGIFRIPSPTLDPRNDELSQAAISRSLPMGSSLPLDEAVLITLASDLFDMGRQSSRLAIQVIKGIDPADLPVETSEIFLTINLATARKIKMFIPDHILVEADKIIR